VQLTEISNTAEAGGRKLTKTGMLFGTPEYMSPEQARGEPIDHRVDIYAMGCMLFQLFTGRVPFEADNFMGLLSLHLASVIDRALAKDRGARWQTIDDLAAAVRQLDLDTASSPVTSSRTSAAPGPATAPPSVQRSRPATDRRPTEWTSRAQVPDVALAAAPPRATPPSNAPVLGALVALAGGALVLFFATQGDRESHRGRSNEPPAGSASEPRSGASAAAASPRAAEPPDASARVTPPAEPPTLPVRVELVLDSRPRGATVTDLSAGKPMGNTPVHVVIDGSSQPRQYLFHLHGYGNSTIELVPDRDKIEHVEVLAKGRSTRAVHAIAVPPVQDVEGVGASASPGAVARPDSGSDAKGASDSAGAKAPDGLPGGSNVADPAKTGDASGKAPEPKCNDEDLPCLKGFGSAK
jgi:serine/threonine-protein kinase